jgi:hypothetical protein
VLDGPGKGKGTAEIVGDQIERSLDLGGDQKLFDELRHAVERRLEACRHFRMAEAW